MSPTTLLNVFLFGAGFFTLACAVMNYGWFFKTNEKLPSLLISALGNKWARIYFAVIGVICLGWGAYRLENPPRDIPVVFLYDLAKPEGIDLTNDKVLQKLKSSKAFQAIKSNNGKWDSFQTILPKSSPHFTDARDAAAAGPDFRKGFHLGSRTVDGFKVEGRIAHFDSEYVICDNVIFSKHPLSSAVFIMVICDEKTSRGEGLTVFFARKGSKLYSLMD